MDVKVQISNYGFQQPAVGPLAAAREACADDFSNR